MARFRKRIESTVPAVSARRAGPTQVDDFAHVVAGALDEGRGHGLLEDQVRAGHEDFDAELDVAVAQVRVGNDVNDFAEQHARHVQPEQPQLGGLGDLKVLDGEDLLDEVAGRVGEDAQHQRAEELQQELEQEAAEDQPQVERARRLLVGRQVLALVPGEEVVDFVGVVLVEVLRLVGVHHVEFDLLGPVAIRHQRPHPEEEDSVQQAVLGDLLAAGESLPQFGRFGVSRRLQFGFFVLLQYWSS